MRTSRRVRVTLFQLDVEGAEWDVEEVVVGLRIEQLMLELHGRPSRWLRLLRRLFEAGYVLWLMEDARIAETSNSTTLGSKGREADVEMDVNLYLYHTTPSR